MQQDNDPKLVFVYNPIYNKIFKKSKFCDRFGKTTYYLIL